MRGTAARLGREVTARAATVVMAVVAVRGVRAATAARRATAARQPALRATVARRAQFPRARRVPAVRVALAARRRTLRPARSVLEPVVPRPPLRARLAELLPRAAIPRAARSAPRPVAPVLVVPRPAAPQRAPRPAEPAARRRPRVRAATRQPVQRRPEPGAVLTAARAVPRLADSARVSRRL